MLSNLIPRVVLTLPSVIPYLKSGFYKTYDYMLDVIERMVRNVYNGQMGGQFVDALQNLLQGQITQAFRQAYEDEGFTDMFPPDYLQTVLDEQLAKQIQFDWIYQYYKDIVDARVDGTPLDPLLARASLWANRYTESYNLAIHTIELENGGKEQWQLGATEQHCWICSALNGIILYAREWETLGIHPQAAPNPVLSLTSSDGEHGCGGWRCDCSRKPTDKRRTPKGFERVMNLVGR